MNELDDIIHGALVMYTENVGTSKAIESVEIVCRTLMTAKEIHQQVNLSPVDVVVLSHMRYTNNIDHVYMALIDGIILDLLINYRHMTITYTAEVMREMDEEYLAAKHPSVVIDTICNIRRATPPKRSKNPYEEV